MNSDYSSNEDYGYGEDRTENDRVPQEQEPNLHPAEVAGLRMGEAVRRRNEGADSTAPVRKRKRNRAQQDAAKRRRKTARKARRKNR
jgi:hypothetical protein